MRQDAGEPYYRVSVEEAKEMLENVDGVTAVDVRALDEYTAGHIKGALHIPVDEILTRMDELPKEQKLLFICAMGVRSGLACEMAAAMGVETDCLYNIEEGTPVWLERNFPASYGTDL